MASVQIELGALGEPLTKQTGITSKAMQKLEEHRVGICRLYFAEMLTQAEANKARDRLAKQVFKLIEEATKP